MFNKEQFDTALEEDEHRNKLSEAAGEIMQHMKDENRFSFDAPLVESDIEILKKYMDDVDGISAFDDLLNESFSEMLPDFMQMGAEAAEIDFNPTASMFNAIYGPVEDNEDNGGFIPTPGGDLFQEK